MTLHLKNLKTAGGEETLRFTANIYLNKLKIGSVSNGGTGGGNEYWFNEKDAEKIFNDYVDRLRKEPFNLHNLFQRILAVYLADCQKTLPSLKQEDIDSDMVIDCQIKLQDDIKKCSKRTVFRLPSDERNTERVINQVFNSELETWIIQKYGSDVTILNQLIATA